MAERCPDHEFRAATPAGFRKNWFRDGLRQGRAPKLGLRVADQVRHRGVPDIPQATMSPKVRRDNPNLFFDLQIIG
jgi:hypothetical protein